MFDHSGFPPLPLTASPQEAAEWCRQTLAWLAAYREISSGGAADMRAVDAMRRAIQWVEALDDPKIEMLWGPPPANTSGKRAELELRSLADWCDGTDQDVWTDHLFGIKVNEKRRLVKRAGCKGVVDLSKTAVGWHIFRVALTATPDQAAYDAMYGDDYPGEPGARGAARGPLNDKLKRLRLRVDRRRLIPL